MTSSCGAVFTRPIENSSKPTPLRIVAGVSDVSTRCPPNALTAAACACSVAIGHSPSTWPRCSATSPAANTRGTPVRIWSSTSTPCRTGTPALRASPTFGRIPVAARKMSHPTVRWSFNTTPVTAGAPMTCDDSALRRISIPALAKCAGDHLRTRRVDVAAQQSFAAFQHGHPQAEQVQRVGGLQTEQAAARHHRMSTAMLLCVCADLHGIGCFAQHEASRAVQPADAGESPRSRPSRESTGRTGALRRCRAGRAGNAGRSGWPRY